MPTKRWAHHATPTPEESASTDATPPILSSAHELPKLAADLQPITASSTIIPSTSDRPVTVQIQSIEEQAFRSKTYLNSLKAELITAQLEKRSIQMQFNKIEEEFTKLVRNQERKIQEKEKLLKNARQEYWESCEKLRSFAVRWEEWIQVSRDKEEYDKYMAWLWFLDISLSMIIGERSSLVGGSKYIPPTPIQDAENAYKASIILLARPPYVSRLGTRRQDQPSNSATITSTTEVGSCKKLIVGKEDLHLTALNMITQLDYARSPLALIIRGDQLATSTEECNKLLKERVLLELNVASVPLRAILRALLDLNLENKPCDWSEDLQGIKSMKKIHDSIDGFEKALLVEYEGFVKGLRNSAKMTQDQKIDEIIHRYFGGYPARFLIAKRVEKNFLRAVSASHHDLKDKTTKFIAALSSLQETYRAVISTRNHQSTLLAKARAECDAQQEKVQSLQQDLQARERAFEQAERALPQVEVEGVSQGVDKADMHKVGGGSESQLAPPGSEADVAVTAQICPTSVTDLGVAETDESRASSRVLASLAHARQILQRRNEAQRVAKMVSSIETCYTQIRAEPVAPTSVARVRGLIVTNDPKNDKGQFFSALSHQLRNRGLKYSIDELKQIAVEEFLLLEDNQKHFPSLDRILRSDEPSDCSSKIKTYSIPHTIAIPALAFKLKIRIAIFTSSSPGYFTNTVDPSQLTIFLYFDAERGWQSVESIELSKSELGLLLELETLKTMGVQLPKVVPHINSLLQSILFELYNIGHANMELTTARLLEIASRGLLTYKKELLGIFPSLPQLDTELRKFVLHPPEQDKELAIQVAIQALAFSIKVNIVMATSQWVRFYISKQQPSFPHTIFVLNHQGFWRQGKNAQESLLQLMVHLLERKQIPLPLYMAKKRSTASCSEDRECTGDGSLTESICSAVANSPLKIGAGVSKADSKQERRSASDGNLEKDSRVDGSRPAIYDISSAAKTQEVKEESTQPSVKAVGDTKAPNPPPESSELAQKDPSKVQVAQQLPISGTAVRGIEVSAPDRKDRHLKNKAIAAIEAQSASKTATVYNARSASGSARSSAEPGGLFPNPTISLGAPRSSDTHIPAAGYERGLILAASVSSELPKSAVADAPGSGMAASQIIANGAEVTPPSLLVEGAAKTQEAKAESNQPSVEAVGDTTSSNLPPKNAKQKTKKPKSKTKSSRVQVAQQLPSADAVVRGIEASAPGRKDRPLKDKSTEDEVMAEIEAQYADNPAPSFIDDRGILRTNFPPSSHWFQVILHQLRKVKPQSSIRELWQQFKKNTVPGQDDILVHQKRNGIIQYMKRAKGPAEDIRAQFWSYCFEVDILIFNLRRKSVKVVAAEKEHRLPIILLHWATETGWQSVEKIYINDFPAPNLLDLLRKTGIKLPTFIKATQDIPVLYDEGLLVTHYPDKASDSFYRAVSHQFNSKGWLGGDIDDLKKAAASEALSSIDQNKEKLGKLEYISPTLLSPDRPPATVSIKKYKELKNTIWIQALAFNLQIKIVIFTPQLLNYIINTPNIEFTRTIFLYFYEDGGDGSWESVEMIDILGADDSVRLDYLELERIGAHPPKLVEYGNEAFFNCLLLGELNRIGYPITCNTFIGLMSLSYDVLATLNVGHSRIKKVSYIEIYNFLRDTTTPPVLGQILLRQALAYDLKVNIVVVDLTSADTNVRFFKSGEPCSPNTVFVWKDKKGFWKRSKEASEDVLELVRSCSEEAGIPLPDSKIQYQSSTTSTSGDTVCTGGNLEGSAMPAEIPVPQPEAKGVSVAGAITSPVGVASISTSSASLDAGDNLPSMEEQALETDQHMSSVYNARSAAGSARSSAEPVELFPNPTAADDCALDSGLAPAADYEGGIVVAGRGIGMFELLKSVLARDRVAVTLNQPLASPLTGFIVVNAKGDGNCFFHACKLSLGYINSKHSALTHVQLRQMAVNYMQANTQKFVGLPRVGAELLEYFQSMRKNEWVDDPTIQALVHALRINILILQIEQNGRLTPILRDVEGIDFDETVVVYYQDKVHYQSVAGIS